MMKVTERSFHPLGGGSGETQIISNEKRPKLLED